MTPVDSSVSVHSGDVASYSSQDALSAPSTHVPTQIAAVQPLLSGSELLERTRRLTSFTWSSSHGLFNCYAVPVANELILSLATVAKMTLYKYISFDSIKLRVTPVSNRYFRGALAATFWPGPLLAANSMPPTRLSSLPTTIYDASSCQAFEMDIPWILPLSKIDLDVVGTNFGFVVFWVASPLVQDTAAAITTSITLNLEATFVNPVLHDPVPSSNLPSVVNRPARFTPSGSFAGLQMPTKSRTVKQEAEAKAEKGTVSSTLDSVSAIAGAASVLPVVGPFAAGLSVVASAASSVFDWFGMSKPTNITIPYFVNTGNLPLSNCLTGATSADVFAASPTPYVSNEPHLVNSYTDELNMSTIRLTPTMIATGTITSTEENRLALTVAVNPYYGWLGSSSYCPSNIDFGTRAFQKWRGDISYKIVFPSSALATCRLAITHSLTKLTTFTEQVRYTYIDVQGTTVVDLTIPWIQHRPYISSPAYFNDIARPSNGFVQVWQILPLTGDGSAETPPPITFFVFASASQNFSTATLRPVSESFANDPPAQGLLGFESTTAITNLLADDNVQSFRELVQRPVWVYQAWAILGGRATIDLKTLLNSNLMRALNTRYRFYRGSLIVSLRLPESDETNYIIMDSTRSCSYLWTVERSPEVNILLPYSTTQGFDDTGALYPNTETRTLVVRPNNSTDTSFGCWISVRFTDDFSMGRCVGTGFLN